MKNFILDNTPSIGCKFLFTPPINSADVNFGDVDINSEFIEIAVALGGFKDGIFIASGTATFIAPGLLITAKHVIQHYLREFSQRPMEKIPNDTDANISIYATHITDNRIISVWGINAFFTVSNTDIAYLQAIPLKGGAKNYKFNKLPIIQFLPPKPGSKIYSYGHRRTTGKLKDGKFSLESNLVATQGIIKEIHHHERDSFMINFPSFQTNAQFDSGMSGGPIFDEEGHLCGIISSNLPPVNLGEEHVSYGALIWLSMSTKIDIKVKGFNFDKEYRIIKLCKLKIIPALNYERITFSIDDDGVSKIGLSLPDSY